LERREHTRFGVRAIVDFEWTRDGIPYRARGLTRDISSKGMFIYSHSEPPANADLEVAVFFHSVAEAVTNIEMKARALVVRVELASNPGIYHGFALLHKSYKLQNGTPNERRTERDARTTRGIRRGATQRLAGTTATQLSPRENVVHQDEGESPQAKGPIG